MFIGWKLAAPCLLYFMLLGCTNPIEEARQEGYADGYNDGMELGREEGREEGHEDGLEEGRQEVLDCVESTDGTAEDAYYACG